MFPSSWQRLFARRFASHQTWARPGVRTPRPFRPELVTLEERWLPATSLLKDIIPGGGSPDISQLTAVGGLAFFVADDGVHGKELWKTDGTAAGTQLVKDIYPGPDGSEPSGLFNFNGTLFFAASAPGHGRELW